MKDLQLTQNRLLRTLNQTRVVDQISIVSMLIKFGLLSVNQLAAEIKLIEVWKSINVDGCRTKMEPYSTLANQPEFRLRPKTNRIFLDTARLPTMFKALLPMFKQLAIFFKNSSPKIDVG